jgi:hypothetical protein
VVVTTTTVADDEGPVDPTSHRAAPSRGTPAIPAASHC